MRSTIACHCRETIAYWESFAGFARFPNGLRGFFGGGASLIRATISWITSAGRETIFSMGVGGVCREVVGIAWFLKAEIEDRKICAGFLVRGSDVMLRQTIHL